jgi:hypothetical protein
MSTQKLSRRAALKALATGGGALALLPALSPDGALAYAALQRAPGPPAPKVLSRAQYATLEALVDAIVPTDERSPGAKAAKVADYIDLLLHESDATLRATWLDGLAAVDAAAQSRFKRPFATLSPADGDTMLAAMSANERDPQTPLERFFVVTKTATIQGYYTSEIGIHQELRYLGNQPALEFVGCHTVDGKDCPHCGQKAS